MSIRADGDYVEIRDPTPDSERELREITVLPDINPFAEVQRERHDTRRSFSTRSHHDASPPPRNRQHLDYSPEPPAPRRRKAGEPTAPASRGRSARRATMPVFDPEPEPDFDEQYQSPESLAPRVSRLTKQMKLARSETPESMHLEDEEIVPKPKAKKKARVASTSTVLLSDEPVQSKTVKKSKRAQTQADAQEIVPTDKKGKKAVQERVLDEESGAQDEQPTKQLLSSAAPIGMFKAVKRVRAEVPKEEPVEESKGPLEEGPKDQMKEQGKEDAKTDQGKPKEDVIELAQKSGIIEQPQPISEPSKSSNAQAHETPKPTSEHAGNPPPNGPWDYRNWPPPPWYWTPPIAYPAGLPSHSQQAGVPNLCPSCTEEVVKRPCVCDGCRKVYHAKTSMSAPEPSGSKVDSEPEDKSVPEPVVTLSDVREVVKNELGKLFQDPEVVKALVGPLIDALKAMVPAKQETPPVGSKFLARSHAETPKPVEESAPTPAVVEKVVVPVESSQDFQDEVDPDTGPITESVPAPASVLGTGNVNSESMPRVLESVVPTLKEEPATEDKPVIGRALPIETVLESEQKPEGVQEKTSMPLDSSVFDASPSTKPMPEIVLPSTSEHVPATVEAVVPTETLVEEKPTVSEPVLPTPITQAPLFSTEDVAPVDARAPAASEPLVADKQPSETTFLLAPPNESEAPAPTANVVLPNDTVPETARTENSGSSGPEAVVDEKAQPSEPALPTAPLSEMGVSEPSLDHDSAPSAPQSVQHDEKDSVEVPQNNSDAVTPVSESIVEAVPEDKPEVVAAPVQRGVSSSSESALVQPSSPIHQSETDPELGPAVIPVSSPIILSNPHPSSAPVPVPESALEPAPSPKESPAVDPKPVEPNSETVSDSTPKSVPAPQTEVPQTTAPGATAVPAPATETLAPTAPVESAPVTFESTQPASALAQESTPASPATITSPTKPVPKFESEPELGHEPETEIVPPTDPTTAPISDPASLPCASSQDPIQPPASEQAPAPTTSTNEPTSTKPLAANSDQLVVAVDIPAVVCPTKSEPTVESESTTDAASAAPKPIIEETSSTLAEKQVTKGSDTEVPSNVDEIEPVDDGAREAEPVVTDHEEEPNAKEGDGLNADGVEKLNEEPASPAAITGKDVVVEVPKKAQELSDAVICLPAMEPGQMEQSMLEDTVSPTSPTPELASKTEPETEPAFDRVMSVPSRPSTPIPASDELASVRVAPVPTAAETLEPPSTFESAHPSSPSEAPGSEPITASALESIPSAATLTPKGLPATIPEPEVAPVSESLKVPPNNWISSPTVAHAPEPEPSTIHPIPALGSTEPASDATPVLQSDSTKIPVSASGSEPTLTAPVPSPLAPADENTSKPNATPTLDEAITSAAPTATVQAPSDQIVPDIAPVAPLSLAAFESEPVVVPVAVPLPRIATDEIPVLEPARDSTYPSIPTEDAKPAEPAEPGLAPNQGEVSTHYLDPETAETKEQALSLEQVAVEEKKPVGMDDTRPGGGKEEHTPKVEETLKEDVKMIGIADGEEAKPLEKTELPANEEEVIVAPVLPDVDKDKMVEVTLQPKNAFDVATGGCNDNNTKSEEDSTLVSQTEATPITAPASIPNDIPALAMPNLESKPEATMPAIEYAADVPLPPATSDEDSALEPAPVPTSDDPKGNSSTEPSAVMVTPTTVPGLPTSESVPALDEAPEPEAEKLPAAEKTGSDVEKDKLATKVKEETKVDVADGIEELTGVPDHSLDEQTEKGAEVVQEPKSTSITIPEPTSGPEPSAVLNTPLAPAPAPTLPLEATSGVGLVLEPTSTPAPTLSSDCTLKEPSSVPVLVPEATLTPECTPVDVPISSSPLARTPSPIVDVDSAVPTPDPTTIAPEEDPISAYTPAPVSFQATPLEEPVPDSNSLLLEPAPTAAAEPAVPKVEVEAEPKPALAPAFEAILEPEPESIPPAGMDAPLSELTPLESIPGPALLEQPAPSSDETALPQTALAEERDEAEAKLLDTMDESVGKVENAQAGNEEEAQDTNVPSIVSGDADAKNEETPVIAEPEPVVEPLFSEVVPAPSPKSIPAIGETTESVPETTLASACVRAEDVPLPVDSDSGIDSVQEVPIVGQKDEGSNVEVPETVAEVGQPTVDVEEPALDDDKPNVEVEKSGCVVEDVKPVDTIENEKAPGPVEESHAEGASTEAASILAVSTNDNPVSVVAPIVGQADEEKLEGLVPLSTSGPTPATAPETKLEPAHTRIPLSELLQAVELELESKETPVLKSTPVDDVETPADRIGEEIKDLGDVQSPKATDADAHGLGAPQVTIVPEQERAEPSDKKVGEMPISTAEEARAVENALKMNPEEKAEGSNPATSTLPGELEYGESQVPVSVPESTPIAQDVAKENAERLVNEFDAAVPALSSTTEANQSQNSDVALPVVEPVPSPVLSPAPAADPITSPPHIPAPSIPLDQANDSVFEKALVSEPASNTTNSGSNLDHDRDQTSPLVNAPLIVDQSSSTPTDVITPPQVDSGVIPSLEATPKSAGPLEREPKSIVDSEPSREDGREAVPTPALESAPALEPLPDLENNAAPSTSPVVWPATDPASAENSISAAPVSNVPSFELEATAIPDPSSVPDLERTPAGSNQVEPIDEPESNTEPGRPLAELQQVDPEVSNAEPIAPGDSVTIEKEDTEKFNAPADIARLETQPEPLFAPSATPVLVPTSPVDPALTSTVPPAAAAHPAPAPAPTPSSDPPVMSEPAPALPASPTETRTPTMRPSNELIHEPEQSRDVAPVLAESLAPAAPTIAINKDATGVLEEQEPTKPNQAILDEKHVVVESAGDAKPEEEARKMDFEKREPSEGLIPTTMSKMGDATPKDKVEEPAETANDVAPVSDDSPETKDEVQVPISTPTIKPAPIIPKEDTTPIADSTIPTSDSSEVVPALESILVPVFLPATETGEVLVPHVDPSPAHDPSVEPIQEPAANSVPKSAANPDLGVIHPSSPAESAPSAPSVQNLDPATSPDPESLAANVPAPASPSSDEPKQLHDTTQALDAAPIPKTTDEAGEEKIPAESEQIGVDKPDAPNDKDQDSEVPIVPTETPVAANESEPNAVVDRVPVPGTLIDSSPVPVADLAPAPTADSASAPPVPIESPVLALAPISEITPAGVPAPTSPSNEPITEPELTRISPPVLDEEQTETAPIDTINQADGQDPVNQAEAVASDVEKPNEDEVDVSHGGTKLDETSAPVGKDTNDDVKVPTETVEEEVDQPDIVEPVSNIIPEEKTEPAEPAPAPDAESSSDPAPTFGSSTPVAISQPDLEVPTEPVPVDEPVLDSTPSHPSLPLVSAATSPSETDVVVPASSVQSRSDDSDAAVPEPLIDQSQATPEHIVNELQSSTDEVISAPESKPLPESTFVSEASDEPRPEEAKPELPCDKIGDDNVIPEAHLPPSQNPEDAGSTNVESSTPTDQPELKPKALIQPGTQSEQVEQPAGVPSLPTTLGEEHALGQEENSVAPNVDSNPRNDEAVVILEPVSNIDDGDLADMDDMDTNVVDTLSDAGEKVDEPSIRIDEMTKSKETAKLDTSASEPASTNDEAVAIHEPQVHDSITPSDSSNKSYVALDSAPVQESTSIPSAEAEPASSNLPAMALAPVVAPVSAPKSEAIVEPAPTPALETEPASNVPPVPIFNSDRPVSEPALVPIPDSPPLPASTPIEAVDPVSQPLFAPIPTPASISTSPIPSVAPSEAPMVTPKSLPVLGPTLSTQLESTPEATDPVPELAPVSTEAVSNADLTAPEPESNVEPVPEPASISEPALDATSAPSTGVDHQVVSKPAIESSADLTPHGVSVPTAAPISTEEPGPEPGPEPVASASPIAAPAEVSPIPDPTRSSSPIQPVEPEASKKPKPQLGSTTDVSLAPAFDQALESPTVPNQKPEAVADVLDKEPIHIEEPLIVNPVHLDATIESGKPNIQADTALEKAPVPIDDANDEPEVPEKLEFSEDKKNVVPVTLGEDAKNNMDDVKEEIEAQPNVPRVVLQPIDTEPVAKNEEKAEDSISHMLPTPDPTPVEPKLPSDPTPISNSSLVVPSLEPVSNPAIAATPGPQAISTLPLTPVSPLAPIPRPGLASSLDAARELKDVSPDNEREPAAAAEPVSISKPVLQPEVAPSSEPATVPDSIALEPTPAPDAGDPVPELESTQPDSDRVPELLSISLPDCSVTPPPTLVSKSELEFTPESMLDPATASDVPLDSTPSEHGPVVDVPIPAAGEENTEEPKDESRLTIDESTPKFDNAPTGPEKADEKTSGDEVDPSVKDIDVEPVPDSEDAALAIENIGQTDVLDAAPPASGTVAEDKNEDRIEHELTLETESTPVLDPSTAPASESPTPKPGYLPRDAPDSVPNVAPDSTPTARPDPVQSSIADPSLAPALDVVPTQPAPAVVQDSASGPTPTFETAPLGSYQPVLAVPKLEPALDSDVPGHTDANVLEPTSSSVSAPLETPISVPSVATESEFAPTPLLDAAPAPEATPEPFSEPASAPKEPGPVVAPIVKDKHPEDSLAEQELLDKHHSTDEKAEIISQVGEVPLANSEEDKEAKASEAAPVERTVPVPALSNDPANYVSVIEAQGPTAGDDECVPIPVPEKHENARDDDRTVPEQTPDITNTTSQAPISIPTSDLVPSVASEVDPNPVSDSTSAPPADTVPSPISAPSTSDALSVPVRQAAPTPEPKPDTPAPVLEVTPKPTSESARVSKEPAHTPFPAEAQEEASPGQDSPSTSKPESDETVAPTSAERKEETVDAKEKLCDEAPFETPAAAIEPTNQEADPVVENPPMPVDNTPEPRSTLEEADTRVVQDDKPPAAPEPARDANPVSISTAEPSIAEPFPATTAAPVEPISDPIAPPERIPLVPNDPIQVASHNLSAPAFDVVSIPAQPTTPPPKAATEPEQLSTSKPALHVDPIVEPATEITPELTSDPKAQEPEQANHDDVIAPVEGASSDQVEEKDREKKDAEVDEKQVEDVIEAPVLASKTTMDVENENGPAHVDIPTVAESTPATEKASEVAQNGRDILSEPIFDQSPTPVSAPTLTERVPSSDPLLDSNTISPVEPAQSTAPGPTVPSVLAHESEPAPNVEPEPRSVQVPVPAAVPEEPVQGASPNGNEHQEPEVNTNDEEPTKEDKVDILLDSEKPVPQVADTPKADYGEVETQGEIEEKNDDVLNTKDEEETRAHKEVIGAAPTPTVDDAKHEVDSIGKSAKEVAVTPRSAEPTAEIHEKIERDDASDAALESGPAPAISPTPTFGSTLIPVPEAASMPISTHEQAPTPAPVNVPPPISAPVVDTDPSQIPAPDAVPDVKSDQTPAPVYADPPSQELLSPGLDSISNSEVTVPTPAPADESAPVQGPASTPAPTPVLTLDHPPKPELEPILPSTPAVEPAHKLVPISAPVTEEPEKGASLAPADQDEKELPGQEEPRKTIEPETDAKADDDIEKIVENSRVVDVQDEDKDKKDVECDEAKPVEDGKAELTPTSMNDDAKGVADAGRKSIQDLEEEPRDPVVDQNTNPIEQETPRISVAEPAHIPTPATAPAPIPVSPIVAAFEPVEAPQRSLDTVQDPAPISDAASDPPTPDFAPMPMSPELLFRLALEKMLGLGSAAVLPTLESSLDLGQPASALIPRAPTREVPAANLEAQAVAPVFAHAPEPASVSGEREQAATSSAVDKGPIQGDSFNTNERVSDVQLNDRVASPIQQVDSDSPKDNKVYVENATHEAGHHVAVSSEEEPNMAYGRRQTEERFDLDMIGGWGWPSVPRYTPTFSPSPRPAPANDAAPSFPSTPTPYMPSASSHISSSKPQSISRPVSMPVPIFVAEPVSPPAPIPSVAVEPSPSPAPALAPASGAPFGLSSRYRPKRIAPRSPGPAPGPVLTPESARVFAPAVAPAPPPVTVSTRAPAPAPTGKLSPKLPVTPRQTLSPSRSSHRVFSPASVRGSAPLPAVLSTPSLAAAFVHDVPHPPSRADHATRALDEAISAIDDVIATIGNIPGLRVTDTDKGLSNAVDQTPEQASMSVPHEPTPSQLARGPPVRVPEIAPAPAPEPAPLPTRRSSPISVPLPIKLPSPMPVQHSPADSTLSPELDAVSISELSLAMGTDLLLSPTSPTLQASTSSLRAPMSPVSPSRSGSVRNRPASRRPESTRITSGSFRRQYAGHVVKDMDH